SNEVTHSETPLDCAIADADQAVAFARTRRAHQQQILGGSYPLQRGQVVERRAWNGRGCDVEAVQRLGGWEAGLLETDLSVGLVSTSDLGSDQGAQYVLGRPALGTRRLEHLSRLRADGGQPQ